MKKLKMTYKKAGIDYSMSCPAICIGQDMDFESCKTFFLTSDKKFVGSYGDNVRGDQMVKWSCQQERFDYISSWAVELLVEHEVDEVCLEGYSMGSRKGLIFNIGENGGLLKHKMWKCDIKIHTPAPTEVKKFFYGKGNAKKEQMYETFQQYSNVDLPKLLNSKASGSPISDIVDSYAMLRFGFTNLFS